MRMSIQTNSGPQVSADSSLRGRPKLGSDQACAGRHLFTLNAKLTSGSQV